MSFLPRIACVLVVLTVPACASEQAPDVRDEASEVSRAGEPTPRILAVAANGTGCERFSAVTSVISEDGKSVSFDVEGYEDHKC